MPPKKHEPPPPPSEDANPFGIFVSITIPAATVVLDLPAEALQDPAAQRKTHITLYIPGSHVPWASTPTAPTEGGQYQYNVVKLFRRSGSQDGLLQLINGTVTVTINDSATNAVLASAVLDEMWGFAIGQNTWTSDDQELTPAAEVPAGVPKVSSARLSSISITLNERQLPEGADPAAVAAAPPPPESELPPLLPYSFVTPEFAETGNMVELVINDISPLPPSLIAANDTAGHKISIAVGVRLPGAGPTVVAHAALGPGGKLGTRSLRREQLSAEACTALQYHLEDGLPMVLEVARYLTSDTLNDPAWEAYHATAPGTELFGVLTSAGATSGSAAGLTLTAFAAGDAKTCLPPYTPPASKSKPVEEAPPAGTFVWEKSGTTISVSFRLARPIIPPWQPPTPPARSLLELIPPRDLTPKPPPTTAADEFKVKVRSIARALAEEYKAVLAPPPAPGQEESSGGGSDARHKALVFELNRSGKYAQMRDSLKASVVALVREKYRKSGTMSPNEMALLYNDLYGTLMAATHSALNDMIDAAAARPRAPLPEAVPDKQKLAKLLELAAQAEAVGDNTRAEALHQRRLLAKNEPQVWYEYGTYCLRRGARGRAEQCFRESLSLEPTHRPALLALLGCSVAEGRATDPAYLEAAEAAAHRLLEVETAEAGAASLDVWAIMSLVYRAFGESKRGELASCEQEMTRLEQEAVKALTASGGPGGEGEVGEGGAETSPPAGELQARAYIALANTFLDTLSLPSEALLALDMASSQRHWPTLGSETHLRHLLTVCLARQALGQGLGLTAEPADPNAEPGAGPMLAPGGPVVQMMRAGGPSGWRAKLLAAQLYRAGGASNEAIRFYQEYVESARQAGLLATLQLPVWLQLAGCYSSRGQHRYAADVYLLGASVAPRCAVLWRGAGECFAAAGDLPSADMSLSEANVLDPEDPLAWGWLALVALREGRQDDAEKALSFGLRCGLDDAHVLLEIANEYGAAGQLRQQQRVLQELAVKLMPESFSMRLMLARCLAAQHMGPEAAREAAVARELAAVEEDEAALAELEEQLRGMA